MTSIFYTLAVQEGEQTQADIIREERVDAALSRLHESMFATQELRGELKKTPPLHPERREITPMEASILTERVAELRSRVISWERRRGADYIWAQDPFTIVSSDPQEPSSTRKGPLLEVKVETEDDSPNISIGYNLGKTDSDRTLDFTVSFKGTDEHEPRDYIRNKRVVDLNPDEFEVATYVFDRAIARVPKRKFEM